MNEIHPNWTRAYRAELDRLAGLRPDADALRDAETRLMLRDALRRAKYSSPGLAAVVVRRRNTPARETTRPRDE